MDNRTTQQNKRTHDAILRVRDMVEDAPYALGSGQAAEVRLTASCRGDDMNPMRLKPALNLEK